MKRNVSSLKAEYYGSLAEGTADRYSDIDIHLNLTEVSDRAFAEILPDILRPVGPPLIDGWGFGALPDLYIRTLFFDSYPLFWHVDIACESEHHIDGSDLQGTYHWPQIFKIWIDVLSNLLRGQDTTAYIERFIGAWADIGMTKDMSPALKFSQYLDWCAERARTRGAPCEALFERCDQLRDEYLA